MESSHYITATLAFDVVDGEDNSDQLTGSGTYSVAVNGDVELTVTQVGGQAVNSVSRGHISADGQFAVLNSEGPSSSNPVNPDNSGGGGGCFISLL